MHIQATYRHYTCKYNVTFSVPANPICQNRHYMSLYVFICSYSVCMIRGNLYWLICACICMYLHVSCMYLQKCLYLNRQYICAHICMYLHVLYVCVCICLYVYIHVRMFVYACMGTYVYILFHIWYLHVCAYMCMYWLIYVCMCTKICRYIQ